MYMNVYHCICMYMHVFMCICMYMSVFLIVDLCHVYHRPALA